MLTGVLQHLTAASGKQKLCFVLFVFSVCAVRCAPAPSQANTISQCNEQNRNPCVTFPDLCSPGGGLCVVKGPCEYQCKCPPDGRLGRDCTSHANPALGSHVDSLLLFPKDIFQDVNHLAKSEDFIKSASSNTTTTTVPKATSSTSSTSGKETRRLLQETTTPSSETTSVPSLHSTLSNIISRHVPLMETATPHRITSTVHASGGNSFIVHQTTSTVSTYTDANVQKITTQNSVLSSSTKPGNLDTTKPTAETTTSKSLADSTTKVPAEPIKMFDQSPRFNTNQNTMSSQPYVTVAVPFTVTPIKTNPDKPSTYVSDVPPTETPRGETSISRNLQNSKTVTQSLTSVTKKHEAEQLKVVTSITSTTKGFSSATTPSLSSVHPSTSTTSSKLTAGGGADEFPTLFKLDTQQSPPDTGVNSPLFRVVHRVFMPREDFQSGRSTP